MDDPMIPDLLTPAQAAEILGMTQQGVQKQIARGALPARRVGRQHVIRRAVVEALADRDGGAPVADVAAALGDLQTAEAEHRSAPDERTAHRVERARAAALAAISPEVVAALAGHLEAR